MDGRKYRSGTRKEFDKPGTHIVLEWGDGVVFQCPCKGRRHIYISKNIHTITFDADGILTLDPSCGYRENKDLGREKNWCHFYLKDGVIEMCDDAECPGSVSP